MILLLQLFVRERNILRNKRECFQYYPNLKSAKDSDLKQIIILSERVINNETPLLFKCSTYGIFIFDDVPSLPEMLNTSNFLSRFLTTRLNG